MWFGTFIMSVKVYKKKHIIEEEESKDKVETYINWEKDNNIVMVWINE